MVSGFPRPPFFPTLVRSSSDSGVRDSRVCCSALTGSELARLEGRPHHAESLGAGVTFQADSWRGRGPRLELSSHERLRRRSLSRAGSRA